MFVGSAKALTKTMYHEYQKNDDFTINGIAIFLFVGVYTFNNNQSSNENDQKARNKRYSRAQR